MVKIKLEIIAISYSQSQTGAYALILGEKEGKRRLPIIIGAFEAQSIAIAIEKMKSSRPLTHDLFKNFAKTFKIDLKEVIIDKYSEGVFFAKLIFVENKKEVEIDSRTSDAVALAVRFNCPIYTYEAIFSAAGIIMEEEISSGKKPEKEKNKVKQENEFVKYNLSELKKMLQLAIDEEAYA
jgi:hypothetical protein